MLSNLVHGLTALTTPSSISWIVVGSLIGMVFGVIPGLGGIVILTMVLGFIHDINLVGVLSFFLGVQAASFYSASITSILLNTPAHPEAFAVTFDGFPMAQRGEPGRALGISACSTLIGGLIGCACLVGFIQIINVLPKVFHPPEYVALILISLLLVGTLGTDSAAKAVTSAGIGVALASIGSSTLTGAFRYTFGATGLIGGISLIALALGCFSIPQMVLVYGTATTIARQDMTGREVTAEAPVSLGSNFRPQVIGGIFETFHHWGTLIRSSLVGVVTGIIPGIGAFTANFLSYGIAQQWSRNRDQFGTGIAEGIIAPEGSSLSKEAGGLVPLLALGIPGGVGNALFLAALSIKGIQMGYGFTKQYPVLPYEMMWVIAVAGILGTAIGVLLGPLLSRVTKVPGPLLVPFIMVLTVVGAFIGEGTYFAVGEAVVFSIVGLILRRLRYSLAAFAIALVLGPTLESNVYQTHVIFPGVSFLQRPLTDVLMAIAIAVMVAKVVQVRKEVHLSRAAIEAEGGHLDRRDQRRLLASRRNPYPLLSVLTTTSIFAISVWFTIYGMSHYSFETALMPCIGGFLAILGSAIRLPIDVHDFVVHVRSRNLPPIVLHEPAPEAVVEEDAFELVDDEVPLVVDVPRGEGPLGRLAAQQLVLGAEAVAVAPGTATAVSDRLPPIREKRWGYHGQYTREVVALLWFVALAAGCYVFGFDICVPVFCFAFGLVATGRVFRTYVGRAIFAIVCAGTMWASAHVILNALHFTLEPLIHL